RPSWPILRKLNPGRDSGSQSARVRHSEGRQSRGQLRDSAVRQLRAGHTADQPDPDRSGQHHHTHARQGEVDPLTLEKGHSDRLTRRLGDPRIEVRITQADPYWRVTEPLLAGKKSWD